MEDRDLAPDFAPFFPRPPLPLPDIVVVWLLVVVELRRQKTGAHMRQWGRRETDR